MNVIAKQCSISEIAPDRAGDVSNRRRLAALVAHDESAKMRGVEIPENSPAVIALPRQQTANDVASLSARFRG
ncbi:hypothetical protein [Rhizobium leguminosarum]|jgi:hypothetical protein|uniref:hypothetical protein n=1 Tax=Rhizobium leguminosarum TaxID=384 RepID=UPI001C977BDB|nr:hypothetical protein [Rhizobium leguminosarum]